MLNTKKNEIITAPNLIAALRIGFDAVTNHVYLLLFPLAFDLFLWLGPRLRMQQLIQKALLQMDMFQQQEAFTNSSDMTEMMQITKEVLAVVAERNNMFASMQTFPVGVPSIMAGRLPLTSPLGTPIGFELDFFSFVLSWLILVFLGLLFGSWYFSLTAYAAIKIDSPFQQSLKNLPFNFSQVLWLTIFLSILLFALGVPLMFLFSAIIIFAGTWGLWIVFALSGLLLWMLMPLVFSPHGIFLNHSKMLHSLWHGLRVVHGNLPRTGLFILLALVISQGMDVLWHTPPEDSWLSVVGIFGHAFISTGLLAASFIYYQQAEKRLQAIVQARQTALSQHAPKDNTTPP